MANPSSRWLKSTEWLAGRLGDDKVVVVDGSYYLTTENRNAKEEYLKAVSYTHLTLPTILRV